MAGMPMRFACFGSNEGGSRENLPHAVERLKAELVRAEGLGREVRTAKKRAAVEVMGRKTLDAWEAEKMMRLFEAEERIVAYVEGFPKVRWKQVLEEAFTPVEEGEEEGNEDVDVLSTTPWRMLRTIDTLVEKEKEEERKHTLDDMRKHVVPFLDEELRDVFEN